MDLIYVSREDKGKTAECLRKPQEGRQGGRTEKRGKTSCWVADKNKDQPLWSLCAVPGTSLGGDGGLGAKARAEGTEEAGQSPGRSRPGRSAAGTPQGR